MIPPVVQAAPADLDALLELEHHLRRATVLLGTLRAGLGKVRRSLAAADGGGPVRDGRELARRRRALGLSQRDLERCAYVSRGYLADLEGGRREAREVVQHVHRTLDALAPNAEGAA